MQKLLSGRHSIMLYAFFAHAQIRTLASCAVITAQPGGCGCEIAAKVGQPVIKRKKKVLATNLASDCVGYEYVPQNADSTSELHNINGFRSLCCALIAH